MPVTQTNKNHLFKVARETSREYHAFLRNKQIPNNAKSEVTKRYKGQMLPPIHRPGTAPPIRTIRVPNSSAIIGSPARILIQYARNRVKIQERITQLMKQRNDIDNEIKNLKALL